MEIVFSVDDGSIHDKKIAKLLEKYGFKGIFYIAPYNRELQPQDKMTFQDIKDLSKRHEIGGHTLTHIRLTAVKTFTADLEVKNGKQVVEEIIGKKITKFAYPRGWHNEAVENIVMENGFKEARTMKLGITNTKGWSRFTKPVTAHLFPRPEYKGNIYYSIIELFERAKKEDGYFNLVMHGLEVEKYDLYKFLEHILKYIKENK